MVFAEHAFRSSRKVGVSGSEGEHADAAAEMFAKLGKVVPKAIAEAWPPCPAELIYLWNLFNEISMGVASNGMSYPTISWECLAAWRAQMRVDLDPWESRALVRLGSLRASILSENPGKDKQ